VTISETKVDKVSRGLGELSTCVWLTGGGGRAAVGGRRWAADGHRRQISLVMSGPNGGSISTGDLGFLKLDNN
jgi:hypothetical protein